MILDEYYYRLLHEIQANGFALVDLQLYLDTHPDDECAADDFVTYSERQRLLKNTFEERYGPLHHNGESTSGDMEAWIEQPWPWQV